MENENSQHLRDPYLFLKDAQAKNIFGKVDFELKSGTHIQYRHPEQEEQFLFISKYYPELNLYYQNFFHITLEHGGENTDTYYYLDFEGNKRGEIPPEQRYFLSEEHLIIGIFICKAYNIDFNSENTKKTFIGF
jgi:chromosome condensin MukBEF MukE localization factor